MGRVIECRDRWCRNGIVGKDFGNLIEGLVCRNRSSNTKIVDEEKGD